VDDDISLGNQRIDGIPVQDVALLVFGPGPSVLGWVKGPPRHPDDPVNSWRTFQRPYC
jgi:hypothetical protein